MGYTTLKLVLLSSRVQVIDREINRQHIPRVLHIFNIGSSPVASPQFTRNRTGLKPQKSKPDFSRCKDRAFSSNSSLFLRQVLIIAFFITSTAVWGEVKLLGVLQWKWLLILLVVVSGRLISGWLVKIVVFILERNFLMK